MAISNIKDQMSKIFGQNRHEQCLILVLLLFLSCRGFASFTSGGIRGFDTLLDTGRFGEADAVIAKTPAGPEREFLQAQEYFFQGKYSDAASEMGLAAAVDSPKHERKAMGDYYSLLAENIKDHEAFSSEHFVLRLSGRDKALALYALDTLEKIYASIGKQFGYYPPEKVLVEIHPQKTEFSPASTLSMDVLEKSGTVGICKFNRIMMLSPEALPLGYSWADTMCHEYVHFTVNRLSRGVCPLWLQEGLAKYFETSWRVQPPEYLSPAAKNSLASAKKNNTYITFKKMHPSLVFLKSQDEILLAFAEVSCAVDFMRSKYGQESIPKLAVNMAVSGEEGAFKKTLGINEEKFEKEFIENLKARKVDESPGAATEKISFDKQPEEEFIGADLRGQVRLGDLMRKAGKPEAAAAQYEKALAIEPANPVILLKTAKALIDAGDSAGAIDKLKAAGYKEPGLRYYI